MKVLSYGVLKALLVKEREKRERKRESKCLGSLAICLATVSSPISYQHFFSLAYLGRLLREDVCRHLNNNKQIAEINFKLLYYILQTGCNVMSWIKDSDVRKCRIIYMRSRNNFYYKATGPSFNFCY